jgi:hypothetical protein
MLACVVLAAPAPCHASPFPSPPEHAIALGPSAAWAVGVDDAPNGPMLGLDFVYVRRVFWGTAGTRLQLVEGSVGAVYPYVEAGLWMLLFNFGIGYSLGLGEARNARSNFHIFWGLPIPLFEENRWLPYVEPYFRPMYSGDSTVLEVGVLVKWLLLWQNPSQRRKPQSVDPRR